MKTVLYPPDLAPFLPWLARWSLEPDGTPFETPYTHSLLLPVRQGGAAAMLKLATSADERRGAAVMVWWDGEGAAPVLAQEGEALLLVRAPGSHGLAAMARDGEDDAATRILCAVVGALHRPRARPPPQDLVPLEAQFRALRMAAQQNGRLAQADTVARALLAQPRDVRVLHGDIHHGNVLDFGARGWLAIDGWGVLGERAYDYANLFCNPDAETALAPGALWRRLNTVADLADLEPARLLRWIIAHAGLSAAWSIEDGQDPTLSFEVMAIAAAALNSPL